MLVCTVAEEEPDKGWGTTLFKSFSKTFTFKRTDSQKRKRELEPSTLAILALTWPFMFW
jgi:hypothetical protein